MLCSAIHVTTLPPRVIQFLLTQQKSVLASLYILGQLIHLRHTQQLTLTPSQPSCAPHPALSAVAYSARLDVLASHASAASRPAETLTQPYLAQRDTSAVSRPLCARSSPLELSETACSNSRFRFCAASRSASSWPVAFSRASSRAATYTQL